MSSATRALRILEELVAAEHPPSRGDLLRALEMPSSTLSTLLAELRATGYVGVIDRRYVPGIGQLQPIHRAAAGRVFLAFTHRSARDIPGEALVKATPNTVVDPDQLDAALELVRRRGYALNRDETIEGVTAIAAPVLVAGAPVAAVTVLGPSQRLADPERTVWPVLRDEVAELADGDIGWLAGGGSAATRS